MPPSRIIGYEIKTLSNLIKRQIDQNTMDEDFSSLTRMQGWIVGFLIRNQNKDMFQRDLEAEFNIRRSTATVMIQRMEKNGLIHREPVSYDARLKKLTLTEKSFSHHERIMKELDNMEKRLSNGLTEQELDAFFSIVEKMKKNVE